MFSSYIIFGILGLCIGSFLNVLLYRLDRRGGIATGRSECTHCHKTLAWHDLVPIISFVALRGRCRYCRDKISLVYPAVEIITALAFMAIFFSLKSQGYVFLLTHIAIGATLVSLIFFDCLYYILPDKILIALLAMSLFVNIYFRMDAFWYSLVCGLSVASFFGILYLVSHGTWIGFGDVKLVFIVSFLLGYPQGLLAIILAIWLASIVGIGLIIGKRASLKTALPLGSFISITTLILITYQHGFTKIIERYYF